MKKYFIALIVLLAASIGIYAVSTDAKIWDYYHNFKLPLSIATGSNARAANSLVLQLGPSSGGTKGIGMPRISHDTMLTASIPGTFAYSLYDSSLYRYTGYNNKARVLDTRDKYLLTRTVTGTADTLTAADNGKKIIFTNGSAIGLAVPSGLPTGFHCLVEQAGSGKITPTGVSATLRICCSYERSKGQYSVLLLTYSGAANTYTISGDLESAD